MSSLQHELIVRDYQPLAEQFATSVDDINSLRKYKALIGHVVHDIRTLMRSVTGSMQVLLEADNNVEAVNEVSNSLDMIANLLEIVTSNKYQFTPAEFNLKSVLTEILTPLMRLFPNVEFSIRIPDDIDFEFDKVGMCRIIHNLVKNACEAIQAHIREDQQGGINVGAFKGPDSVTLMIQDNGPGIPAEKLDSIFTPGFTTKKGSTSEGRGLGLANVAEMVAAHSGKITLFTSHAGTSFCINLPEQQKSQDVPEYEKPHVVDAELTPMVEELMAKQSLVRHVVTDIRRLMGGIRSKLAGVADLNQAENIQAVNAMEKSVSRISHLLEIMLNSSPNSMPREINLKEIVAEVVELLSEAHPGVQYKTKVPDDAILMADDLSIYRIIHNLALNAGEAFDQDTQDKTVNIRVVTTKSAEGEIINIVVSDNGPGIPEDDLTDIFDPSYSTKGSSDNGRGLGLYHVMQLVSAHGGTVEAQPKTQGVSFRVQLPVANMKPSTQATAPSPQLAEEIRQRLSEYTMVLLEDDPATADLFWTYTFAKLGVDPEKFHHVETFSDFLALFDRLEMKDTELLVVSDVNFPQGSAEEVVEFVRRSFPRSKLVVNSNALAEDELSKYKELGADHALVKPLTIDESRLVWSQVFARLLANDKKAHS